MNSIIIYILLALSTSFLFVSIIYNHLIFSILSTISWLITAVSFIQIDFVTGVSETSIQSLLSMFFFGISIISVMWTIKLILSEVQASVGGENEGVI